MHQPPSAGEIDKLDVWQRLDKERRHEFVMLALAAPHDGLPCLERFLPTAQRKFLRWALCHVRATESPSDCCSEI